MQNKNGNKNSKEISKRGRVVEALPNAQFKVEYEDGTNGIAYLGGKMKVYKIRVLVGDHVEAIVDPYSKKGRIIKRG
jgi:translation initiation factor IF-1